MSRRTLLIACLVALPLLGVGIFLSTGDPASEPATENELTWTSFDAGITQAHAANKKILVDIYTDWCVWCKRMDKDVYSDPDVRRELLAHFVLVKLNAESERQLTFHAETLSEAAFSHAVGVTGYPTTLFLDEQAKPITLLPGYVKPASFVSILSFIGGDFYKQTTFQKYIEAHPSPKQ